MELAVFSVLTAILTRLLFAAHCLVTVWRVVDVYKQDVYWCLLAPLGLLFIETCVTLAKRKGRELKWFCPSFLFYLFGVVPGIWFLELDRLRQHRDTLRDSLDWSENSTTAALFDITTSESVTDSLISHTVMDWNSSWPNTTDSIQLMTASGSTQKVDNLSTSFQEVTTPFLDLFEIPLRLDPDTWVNSIEQSMLLLLIIGRWFLPKGDITRDQLSQLLFVYIGVASDIMELYYLFQEPKVLNDQVIGCSILAVWTLSLLQFTLVLTATKARKPRVALPNTASSEDDFDAAEGSCSCFCESEVWSIIIMVILQDLPFLTIRLYVIITFKLFTYSILFFTAKNVLVILLQIYRLIVIGINHEKKENTPESGSVSINNGKKQVSNMDMVIIINNQLPRENLNQSS